MAEGRHTVGAQIGDLRVPEQHLAALSELNSVIERGADQHEILTRVVGMLSTANTLEVGDTETHDGGVLNTDRANFEKRFQPDPHNISTICAAMRQLGHKIVLTSGTFDIIHIGHAQYLEAASRFGDFLVVGVDSDEKVKQKKGANRPVVQEEERLRMLSHLRSVDLLTLKNANDPHWQLIRIVNPHTLIATEGTYTDDEVDTLENAFVDRVVVLPPQATTSTTARLRRLGISQYETLQRQIEEAIEGVLTDRLSSEERATVNECISGVFRDISGAASG